MIARVLPPEEWPRLSGTEAESVWPQFNPENTQVLVVEEDGEIVATWTMLRVVHAECLWVSPKYKGSFGVAKRLFRGLRKIAAGWGATRVVTGSVSPDVTALIKRFGGEPMPCESFVLPVDGPMSKRMARDQGWNPDIGLGRLFHAQLAVLVDDQHPDDLEHDSRVGRALRRAIEGGEPEQAAEEYNAWARPAGYEPIRYLGMVDGRMRADIVTAVVEVDRDYSVRVVAQEVEPCR